MIPTPRVEVLDRGLGTLRPHPQNEAIYGVPDCADLVDSIREDGLQMPLLISFDGRVISGHRRLAAAKVLGLATVPVIVSPATAEHDILALLLQNNVQRAKSTAVIGREMAAMEGVVRARMRERQATLNNQQLAVPPEADSLPATLPEANHYETRQMVGEAFGMGGRTAGRIIQVTKEIATLAEEGRKEEADQVEDTLNRRGALPALRLVREIIDGPQEETAEAAPANEQPAQPTRPPVHRGRPQGSTWYERLSPVARALETVPDLAPSTVRKWSPAQIQRTLEALDIQIDRLKKWKSIVEAGAQEDTQKVGNR